MSTKDLPVFRQSLPDIELLPPSDRQMCPIHKDLGDLLDQTRPKTMHKWRWMHHLLLVGLQNSPYLVRQEEGEAA